MSTEGSKVRRVFRLTNARVRLGVGLVLLALFCIQCTNSQALRESDWVTVVSGQNIGQTSPQVVGKLEELAQKDPCALLRLALERYDNNYQDYTCTFIKQERIRGRLRPEQWIQAKFMAKPFSVAMEWVKNIPIADRVIYVDGKYNGLMLIRPAGIWSALLGTQMRDPRSKQVMENTLRPVTMFGFRRSLESILKVYELAEKRGELVKTYEGRKEVFGQPTLVLVRTLPPRDDYPAKKTVVYLSVDHLVPLAVEGYDWDDQRVCRYVFKDVKFNVGLTEKDFTPQANDMQPPKQ